MSGPIVPGLTSFPTPAFSPDDGSGRSGEGAEDERLGELCRLARQVFDCPTVLVSLLARGPEGGGLDGLDAAFAEEVLASGEALVVTDALADPRFCEAFLVVAYPFVRFYAGVPVDGPDGTVAGVFSLIDYRGRPGFGADEIALMWTFARLASGEVERRVAERMRLNDALQLERLADAARRGVVEIDDGGRIVRANRAVQFLTGAGADALVGAPAARFLVGAERLTGGCLEALHAPGAARACGALVVDLVALDGRVHPFLAYLSHRHEGGRIVWRMVLEPRV